MFNIKFLGKRKYAVYKKNGEPWTQEEYGIVTRLFEGSSIRPQRCLDPRSLVNKYITDRPEEDSPLYHVWSHTQQALEEFTKISYEDLLKQSKLKLLKRKELWISK